MARLTIPRIQPPPSGTEMYIYEAGTEVEVDLFSDDDLLVQIVQPVIIGSDDITIITNGNKKVDIKFVHGIYSGGFATILNQSLFDHDDEIHDYVPTSRTVNGQALTGDITIQTSNPLIPGTGIDITDDFITNTDTGSSAIASHNIAHDHTLLHAVGSDIQDLSGLLPNSHLVDFTHNNIHAPHSDDQDLSGLLPTSHLNDFTHSNIHAPGSDNQDLTPYELIENLGTAAYEDTGAFATAAQGTLADTAIQDISTLVPKTFTINNNDLSGAGLTTDQLLPAQSVATNNHVLTSNGVSGSWQPAASSPSSGGESPSIFLLMGA